MSETKVIHTPNKDGKKQEKSGENSESAGFEATVKRMLETPPKPYKEKDEKTTNG